MPASRAKQALTAQRRTEMFQRRRAGESMTSIAESFGITRQTLSKDFTRAYRAYLEEATTETDIWRQFQTDRYEELLAAVWPDALTGDVRANEQASKLIDKLSELNGWKQPVRTEISGPDGGDIPFSSGELSELKALIEISDQPNASVPAFDHDSDGDAGTGDDDDSDN